MRAKSRRKCSCSCCAKSASFANRKRWARWLRSITHRLSLNRLARGGHERPSEPELLEACSATTQTPLTSALAQERASQVRAGLDRLRPLDRATLEAFYVHGQSLVEMADAFDSPVGTIKRRLHVARQRLGRELGTMNDE